VNEADATHRIIVDIDTNKYQAEYGSPVRKTSDQD